MARNNFRKAIRVAEERRGTTERSQPAGDIPKTGETYEQEASNE